MLRAFSFAVLAVVLATASVPGEDRFALVIGNGKYSGAGELKNPPSDAAAVAAALEKLDFKVTKKTDVDIKQLEHAIAEFGRRLKKDSIALFFYAGHGVQVKGENYLVPIGVDLEEEAQVKRTCLQVETVL